MGDEFLAKLVHPEITSFPGSIVVLLFAVVICVLCHALNKLDSSTNEVFRISMASDYFNVSLVPRRSKNRRNELG